MATVSAQLGSWINGQIVVTVFYDNVTFAVSSAQVVNNAPARCRFTVWRNETPGQAVSFNVNSGQTRSGKPTGTVIYHPEENPDGVTPAGNLEIRVEYPA